MQIRHHRQGLQNSLTKAHQFSALPHFASEPNNHYLCYFLSIPMLDISTSSTEATSALFKNP